MNFQWNPYFNPKENVQQLNNISLMRFDENQQQPLYNKQNQFHKKISIQPTSQPENIKYKINKKQSSCVPFQMNVPQQTSNQTLTKVAQLSLKPIFSKPKCIEKNIQNENLKGSAIWERKDFQNQQITFESFLKDQNVSRNNSIEHNSNKSHFKKNHRQYSHVVQGNSGAYFMISNIPQNTNTNTNTTNSYYSNCENCNSQREEKQIEKINVPKFFIPEDNSNQLSERTIKKQSPNNLLKHKKNTRCISMGEQKQIGLTLECDESSITILSDNANTILPNSTNSKNNNILQNENPNYQNSQIGGFSQETLQVLMLQEIEYAPNSDYLQSIQTQITPLMRAILMDWMIEVCSVYFMKRDTYYLAVAYVDSYLSKKAITKSELQLLGTASMLIASKMEEVEAKNPKDFEKASNYGYSLNKIYEMEKEICKSLQWHLNIPTINLWIEFYTNQWDNFITDVYKKFRSNNNSSYKIMLKLQGFIDCCYLDIETLSYKPRKIVASFMYLVLALEYEQFTKEYIYYEIPKTSKFILADSQKSFNRLFTEFAQISFGFNLVDLIDIIQYASKFIMLDFKYSDTIQDKINIQRHEDLLIYQKYNQTGLSFIRYKLQK
ncbi:unnamed protein product [Paramecium sonneborni]|uniref:Cyclin-like domain-containing protein n=1 Tax=Paramecium sonneborni TaxID=65129 RepID=A0A8S1JYG2_9CILI|nr:unnamed protein product [Paramecium sonneborni]